MQYFFTFAYFAEVKRRIVLLLLPKYELFLPLLKSGIDNNLKKINNLFLKNNVATKLLGRCRKKVYIFLKKGLIIV